VNRGKRGRTYAKAEFIVAVVATLLAALLYVSMPAYMFTPRWPDWLETAMVPAPIVGVVIGFVWMARIYRANPEPDHGDWRYRANRKRHSSTGANPVQRGRMYAKAEFIVAVVATLGIALWWAVGPMTTTPMFEPHLPLWLDVGTGAGPIVGVVIGFVWMVRIYRANPEPDHGAWRYRANR